MKNGKCKICGKIKLLTKHHFIPKRLKSRYDQVIYVCENCHKKIHPENEIILRVKQLTLYHKTIKKFLKERHPKVWDEWSPYRDKIKKMYDESIKNTKLED